MVFSVSLVVLLGVITVVMIKSGKVRAVPAAVLILFGFYLGGTDMAPGIRQATANVVGVIRSIDI